MAPRRSTIWQKVHLWRSGGRTIRLRSPVDEWRGRVDLGQVTGAMDTGVWSWSELVAEIGRVALRRQVAAGRLVRVGHGWYAAPTAAQAVISAVRLGGHLGCLSGCAVHGLWVPPEPGLHVTFNRRVPAVLPPLTVGHHARELGCEAAVRPLLECLAEVVRHHDIETALIVLDSALNQRLVTEAEAVHLVRSCPRATHRVLRYVEGRADSGTETRVRYLFQRRGIPVEPQVRVRGVGRVDLLVGRSLMIECDSRQHHTGEENYSRDRARDLVLVQDGNRVVRLTFQQVFHQWPQTSAALIRLTRAGLHRPLPLSAK